MKIAQFKGTTGISRAIRFITRSPYSHSAFIFDEAARDAVKRLTVVGADLGTLTYFEPGSVIEAWNSPSAVRNTESIRAGHDANVDVDIFHFATPLTPTEEENLILALIPELGWPYDWKGVFRFITRRPGNLDKAWFCSELVAWACAEIGRDLFHQTQPWEVPPDWIARSPLLRYETTLVT